MSSSCQQNRTSHSKSHFWVGILRNPTSSLRLLTTERASQGTGDKVGRSHPVTKNICLGPLRDPSDMKVPDAEPLRNGERLLQLWCKLVFSHGYLRFLLLWSCHPLSPQ